jgi:diguanylate cyclase (GGDEF)-like protein
MPVMDGLDLCRWIRQQQLPSYVYTIFITSRSASEDLVSALEAGADDFLKKPADKAELIARVQSSIRVLELESRLNFLAKTDALTGLATRRTFFEHMEKEWSRSQRNFIPMSCVMLDIDFFKRINDTYGHGAGDQALRGVANILQDSCRGSDFVGRYGGEEFCVLLPETTEHNALLWADRVRQRIAAKTDLIADPNVGVTASFGVAQRLADTHNSEELVDLADQALLVAKRSGRDRVIGFQSLGSSSRIKANTAGPSAMFHGLSAQNVMTTIVAGLNENATVGRAVQYFLRFRFNFAPVVDNEGQLVGVLSERDAMSIMMWPKWWKMKIQDVMKRNVVCYEEDTPVLLIYEFLCRVSLRAVVIVKDRRPTGIISRGSLLRWFTNLRAVNPAAVLEGPSLEVPADHAPESDAVSALSEPRQNITMIVQALAREAQQLEGRVAGEEHDLVPAVVGGVSRIEELLNDLLAYSRYANADSSDQQLGSLLQSQAAAPLADTVTQP